MPTISGSRTLREVGDVVIDHLTDGTYSAPYDTSVVPKWYWKLRYEQEFVPLATNADGLLTIVTPDLEGCLELPEPDCEMNLRYGLLVIITKKLSGVSDNDAANEQEINELAQLSQEIGEGLFREMPWADLRVNPFIDQDLLVSNRLFASSWSITLV